MTVSELPAFYDMPYTTKDGDLTSESHLYNDQMFQTLNDVVNAINALVSSLKQADGTLKINGLNPPSYTTAEIAAIAADTDNPVPVGTIWFDTDLKKLKVLVNKTPVTIETITSA
jgi:hypothetical protein